MSFGPEIQLFVYDKPLAIIGTTPVMCNRCKGTNGNCILIYEKNDPVYSFDSAIPLQKRLYLCLNCAVGVLNIRRNA